MNIEIMSFVGNCLELKVIMLSEINCKDKYRLFSVIYTNLYEYTIYDENRALFAKRKVAMEHMTNDNKFWQEFGERRGLGTGNQYGRFSKRYQALDVKNVLIFALAIPRLENHLKHIRANNVYIKHYGAGERAHLTLLGWLGDQALKNLGRDATEGALLPIPEKQGNKDVASMLGNGSAFGDLILLVHLGLWSIHGGGSCKLQLYVKRHSAYSISAGQFFKMECPVEYCDNRPNMTWCKSSGMHCLPLGDRRQLRTTWEERRNVSVFILHFDPVLPSDNGSYRCSASSSHQVIHSHFITIYITEQTQNNSERLLINATSGSGPPSRTEAVDMPWLAYCLLPLGGLLLILIICFWLVHALKRRQGKGKKPSDVAGRELNLVDVPQPFESERTEASPRPNVHTLPSEAEIYNNDPSFRMQEGLEVYSNPQVEGNKQGIVYASLNHSFIGRNPKQARSVREAPTEYASICKRS
uniref:B- and T-lymphocyte attenuator n=1 Tax=Jaculus jaculus TaxID=51337 RepID=UPI001E1B4702|nr:B- and T-lymphocyte attenuator [Jaculus jaculus]